MKISLLIADDEDASHRLAEMALAHWRPGELKIRHARSPAEARAAIAEESFHLALLDLHYGPGEPAGFSLLTALKEADPSLEMIVVSSAADFSAVQAAMRAGAGDYVAKGYGRTELCHALDRALERRRWRLLEKRVAAGSNFALVGGSPAIEKMKSDLRKFAPKDVAVLLEGETGAGKEIAARAIHQWGRDPTAAFVAVNCAAVPESTADSFFFGHERGAFTGADRAREGVFEEADGGTLFLDEVNSLTLELQGKLLRVLQEKEVRRMGSSKTRAIDFRLVTATNQPLSELVAKGTFREDLFYRLNVLTVKVPPLRERAEDIEALAKYFLPGRELTCALRDLLKQHSWPGNVRELRNVLQAADALSEPGEVIDIIHLPEHALARIAAADPREAEEDLGSFAEGQEEREREFLAKAYRGCSGNVSKLSRMLGVDRSHLHQKLTRLGIHKARNWAT